MVLCGTLTPGGNIMKVDTYSSAIAANAVLRELLMALKVANVLDDKAVADLVFAATRRLNQTNDPTFQEAAKAVLALYNR
jgi:hypothetical protein